MLHRSRFAARRVGLAMVLLCTISSALYGQAGRASISGVITDTSGAIVPDATIVAINAGTGINLLATSNEIGAYVIPLVPVGTYTVSVKKDGFKTEIHTGVLLTADQVATLNFSLSV